MHIQGDGCNFRLLGDRLKQDSLRLNDKLHYKCPSCATNQRKRKAWQNDVSLRGKVHTDFTGRSLLSHHRACRFTVNASTKFHLHRHKKSAAFSTPVWAKHTDVQQNCMTTFYSDFHNKRPRNMKVLRQ